MWLTIVKFQLAPPTPPPPPTPQKTTTPFSKGFGRSAGLSLNTIKRRIIIFSPYCLNKGSFGGVFTDHLHSIPKRRRVNSNNKQTTMEMKTFRVFFFALLLLASPLLQGPPFLISGSRSVHARPHFFDSFHDFVDTIVLIFFILIKIWFDFFVRLLDFEFCYLWLSFDRIVY